MPSGSADFCSMWYTIHFNSSQKGGESFIIHSVYSTITPEILALAELSPRRVPLILHSIQKFDVKRGLRDLNGKGVLTGLTNIFGCPCNRNH